MEDPFAKHVLSSLLSFQGDSDVLLKYEGADVEYKKSFHYKMEKFIKTIVAFANNAGGYLVFGVEDGTRKVVGLQDHRFERFDTRELTKTLNDYVSGEIEWKVHLYEFDDGRKCGLIYVAPSSSKPLMIIKTSSQYKLKEGEIYYRYPGETRLIRAPELQKIIDNLVLEERQRWQKLISQIALISPQDISLINLKNGQINEQYGTILIDENIIRDVKFVKEGEFREVEGAPTLKLVGDVVPVSRKHVLVRKQFLSRRDIFDAFFSGTCDNPLMYLESLPYQNTYLLPIWFFILQSGYSVKEVTDLYSALEDANSFAKSKLISRLSEDKLEDFVVESTYQELEYNVSWKIENWGQIKREFSSELISAGTKKIDRTIAKELLINAPESLKENLDIVAEHSAAILKAITHVKPQYIMKNREIILEIAHAMFEKAYSINGTAARKVICYLDLVMYRAEVIDKS